MKKNRARFFIYGMVALVILSFKIGTLYEKQICESSLETERLYAARVRYDDWSAFTSHLTQDRKQKINSPLALTHSRNLSERILAPVLPNPCP